MSQIHEALDVILKVSFRDAAPAEVCRIGSFVEQAAEEVQTRLSLVEKREEDVSAREAACELREEALASQIKALGSVQRIVKTLGGGEVKRSRWWR